VTNVLLKGFGFAGFRSFGEEIQRIGPMSKVHLLAGPNNPGKSNVLTFARRVLPQLAVNQAPGLASVDYPRRGTASLEMPVAQ